LTVLEQIQAFSQKYARRVVLHNTNWTYYKLGSGKAILWLTGGLRRAALGFGFMEKLGNDHCLIAPDYPPVQTIGEYNQAWDAILQAEGIGSFTLVGQSYGGMLAQAYLAHNPQAVERLILSSSGPADYGLAWLPVEYFLILLIRLLPEKTVKNLLTGGLTKIISVPEKERLEWMEAFDHILQNDLSRGDVVSHFAVAADLIRQRSVFPGVYKSWTGKTFILSSENDPTQSRKDLPHYKKLFGREVEAVNMGDMGHTALLFNPQEYIHLLERIMKS